MHHYWSGGTFAGYTATRVKYYVDNGTMPAADLPLGPAHGLAVTTVDDNAPWSAGALFGRAALVCMQVGRVTALASSTPSMFLSHPPS